MTDQPLETNDTLPERIEDAHREIELLRKIQKVTVMLASITELQPLIDAIVELAEELIEINRALLLVTDEENISLKLGSINRPLSSAEDMGRLQGVSISTYNADDDAILGRWLARETFHFDKQDADSLPESRIKQFLEFVGFDSFYSVPLYNGNRLIGVLIVELLSGKSLTDVDLDALEKFAVSCAGMLYNARMHTRAVTRLAMNMREMGILQQIDRELNETIALSTVFNMTLDWALRFTNANVATISLYEEETDSLRTMLNYGYSLNDEDLYELRSRHHNTVTHRVARSGRIEVVPDVYMDKDYAPVAQGVQSQLAVPVLREDRVVAVITLESYKLNAFTDENVDFTQKLANRAAVAIDNARLYDETVREREKLSYILRSIGDVVIVVDANKRIVLISRSAVSALRLQSTSDYTNQTFSRDVIGFEPLIEIFQRAVRQEEEQDSELALPNDRVYFVRVTPQPGTGWIIVMQDVTPYKETDRLKSELIATVSHDLKQPLGVMRGYLDLLQMKNDFEETSQGFVKMIDRAINNMRQLIDDLLDLARIESGMDLDYEIIALDELLRECLDTNMPVAEAKSMTVITDLPDHLPEIRGERSRIAQIFNNLIGNAIKYTDAGGQVKVSAEQRGLVVRISVQDNGMGISPEDQPHIFDRFYRVRRAETESIDGTGLGLAIVKSLVEAHRGKIRLESRLGEGSTFYVTLPVENT